MKHKILSRLTSIISTYTVYVHVHVHVHVYTVQTLLKLILTMCTVTKLIGFALTAIDTCSNTQLIKSIPCTLNTHTHACECGKVDTDLYSSELHTMLLTLFICTRIHNTLVHECNSPCLSIKQSLLLIKLHYFFYACNKLTETFKPSISSLVWNQTITPYIHVHVCMHTVYVYMYIYMKFNLSLE